MADTAEWTTEDIDEALDVLAEFMEQTLDVLDVDPDTEIDLQFQDDRIIGDLDGDEDDIALIIGRRGQTLDAIQYLASAVVMGAVERYIPIELDAQGYRRRRSRQLEKNADRAVGDVLRTGQRVELEPMTSSERKVIHQYLKDHPEIATVSSGREPNRRLCVEPRQG